MDMDDIEIEMHCAFDCHDHRPLKSASAHVLVQSIVILGAGVDLVRWVERQSGILSLSLHVTGLCGDAAQETVRQTTDTSADSMLCRDLLLFLIVCRELQSVWRREMVPKAVLLKTREVG
ncbi:hypothetical protein RRG08_063723 [Elysia crispata]|uniref:Uncharacterized protein n=1 Tax=Elysia crispata TaxID=231223 RepID=A0AAE0ZV80_9GAST|nr:hypothetical protein RRG08_063723 [Elysia crispata]